MPRDLNSVALLDAFGGDSAAFRSREPAWLPAAQPPVRTAAEPALLGQQPAVAPGLQVSPSPSPREQPAWQGQPVGQLAERAGPRERTQLVALVKCVFGVWSHLPAPYPTPD